MAAVQQVSKTQSGPAAPKNNDNVNHKNTANRRNKGAKFERIEAAFEFFNDTSSMLAESYKVLEQRVTQLTKELDYVNTQKKQSEENKAQLALRMQAILDFVPGGIIILDQQGYVVESNPAAKTILEDTLDGHLWRDVIQRCFAPRNDDGLEVSTKTGRRISLSTSSMDNQGQIILLTDQTETRELQKNVSRYERLSVMGKMVSALAHQIRTPLSAAMLYGEHVNNEAISPEKRQVFSKKLFGRLQHMERTVRDMMLFVKSELPLNDLMTLDELKDELIDAMDAAITTHGATVIWQVSDNDFFFRCHKEALTSAIMNLINNALQASLNAVEITIDLSKINADKTPPDVQINITDNGPGMSKEALNQAHELFVTTKSHGTGLGLSVVQSVSKAHGGYLKLTSQEGCGTTASIVLPAHSSQAYNQHVASH